MVTGTLCNLNTEDRSLKTMQLLLASFRLKTITKRLFKYIFIAKWIRIRTCWTTALQRARKWNWQDCILLLYSEHTGNTRAWGRHVSVYIVNTFLNHLQNNTIKYINVLFLILITRSYIYEHELIWACQLFLINDCYSWPTMRC